MASVEQLVSREVDRVVAAIQQFDERKGTAPTAHRRDLREQVTSQVPEGAVGYRLVLPSRTLDDGIRLSPRRSQSREVAWYTLSPFEYPADLRLRDGHWYHLVWYDVQGRRMRPPAEHGIPALYYFLGPASQGPAIEESPEPLPPTIASSSSTASQQPAPEPSGTQAAAEPGIPQPPVPSSATSQPTAIVMPPQIHQSSAQAQPQAPQIREVLPGGVSVQSVEAFDAALSSFPKVPLDMWTPIHSFVVQVPWMIWLMYEDRRRDALRSGRQPPAEPTLSLPRKDRDVMAKLLPRLPTHFIPLCKKLFACVREHGTDVLQLAPVPFHPLPEEQQQPLLRALRDAEQRTYLDYVCRWQDAMLSQAPVPAEPETKLRSEQRREIWRWLIDLRAVMLVRRHSSL